MKYRAGYKYQLVETEVFQTVIRPLIHIETWLISLTGEGVLTVRRGYAWDGPSGPTWDTKNSMRGSAYHDAIYQLIRQEHLESRWREYADAEMNRILKEDGMWWLRRKLWVRAVRWGGASSANPDNIKPILTAP